MKSTIINIMNDAYTNDKSNDFITKKCQIAFGGSWILIHHRKSQCDFEMSFASESLKWIKFKRGYHYYALFQISE